MIIKYRINVDKNTMTYLMNSINELGLTEIAKKLTNFMNKRLILLLTALVMLCGAISAANYDFHVGGVYYRIIYNNIGIVLRDHV